MRAVRIDSPGEIRVVDIETPEPGPGEVVVDVAYAGVCGSDVEIYSGRRAPGFVRYPVVPGHEWSGVVAAAGEGADADLVGRKVVGEGFRSCRACRPCLAGEPVLCEAAYDEIGFTRPGAWSDRLVLLAEQLHVLRDDADLRAAAGLEPAACAADVGRRASVEPGDRVAIVGGGNIGALVVQLLRASRPAELIVVEPDEHRAAAARVGGASDVVSPEAAAGLAGRFDVVVESAGVASTPALCVELVRRGGHLVLAGIPDATATIFARDLVTKRVELDTVFGAPSEAWRDAVAAFADGRLDPGALVTHELPLGKAEAALTLLTSDARDVGKVLLRP